MMLIVATRVREVGSFFGALWASYYLWQAAEDFERSGYALLLLPSILLALYAAKHGLQPLVRQLFAKTHERALQRVVAQYLQSEHSRWANVIIVTRLLFGVGELVATPLLVWGGRPYYTLQVVSALEGDLRVRLWLWPVVFYVGFALTSFSIQVFANYLAMPLGYATEVVGLTSGKAGLLHSSWGGQATFADEEDNRRIYPDDVY